VSFFAIPLARYLAYQRRNASIEAENDARRDALARLRMPEPGLVAKLESASQRAQRRVIQDEVCTESSFFEIPVSQEAQASIRVCGKGIALQVIWSEVRLWQS